MSAYDLKQHLNEWTNIEVSINNNTGTVDLFVNGTQQQFTAGANTTAGTGGSLNISDGKQITKNSNSKFHIGGNKDGNKEFTGKMERIEFSNKVRNSATALANYQNLKKRESNSMLNMKFKPSTTRNLGEGSKYKSKAKFNKQSDGATIEVIDGRDAVKFKSADYIEMNAPTSMYGDKLLNSTFTSWVKLPSTSSGYEPIISRENVFSFGINNGHASLFLSQNNQLAPGTNVSKEDSSVVTVAQMVSSVMEPTHKNLLVDANFNTTNTNITKPVSSEYSSIISGSKVVKLTSSDKIEVNKTALIGKNMNKFTFSGWVNFSSLNDNAILFERPDAGLKLSTNASGQVKLNYKKTIGLIYKKVFNTSNPDPYGIRLENDTLSVNSLNFTMLFRVKKLDSGLSRFIQLYDGSPSSQGYHLYDGGSSTQLRTSGDNPLHTNNQISNNEWAFIAFSVYEEDGVLKSKFVVNNNIDTKNYSNSNNATLTTLQIGDVQLFNSDNYYGAIFKMDYLAIYDRGLSDSELLDIYNENITPNSLQNLNVSYQFNGNLNDDSGKDKHLSYKAFNNTSVVPTEAEIEFTNN